MTDNITALIAEGRDYASRRFGTVPGDLAHRLADALEAEHKRAEVLLVDLDTRFEHSDHTAAKYYRRMREAEALAQKANLSIIDLVRMGNERADERDRYRAALIELATIAKHCIPVADVDAILARALNENGETDGA